MQGLKNVGKSLSLKINAVNDGKYRFKQRNDNRSIGTSFSTRTNIFDEKVYLEWQIGYDAIVTDVKNGKKNTGFKKKTFIGANKKEKYLYELSEIVLEACKLKLISREVIETAIEEIKGYKEFMEKDISLNNIKDVKLNGLSFCEAVIELPTFIKSCDTDDSQIEIAMEKQQYAAGVQPMVYYCIPIKCFDNYKGLLEKSSVGDDFFEYIIDKDKAVNFILIMKIFGMASEKHKFDILEILKIIEGEINER